MSWLNNVIMINIELILYDKYSVYDLFDIFSLKLKTISVNSNRPNAFVSLANIFINVCTCYFETRTRIDSMKESISVWINLVLIHHK